MTTPIETSVRPEVLGMGYSPAAGIIWQARFACGHTVTGSFRYARRSMTRERIAEELFGPMGDFPCFDDRCQLSLRVA